MNIITKLFKRFMKLETSSSIVLLLTAVVAIIWANSSLGIYYEKLWAINVGIEIANYRLHLPETLFDWINDGLMAIFFFLVGLEIKREILGGELSSIKKASLPIWAALGGMIVPVIIFYSFLYSSNLNDIQMEEWGRGWAIPMATDIAFSLGILKLLGNRVPIGLKILLMAFAIVDDIGAILVIAIAYSSNIHIDLLVYSAIILGFLTFLAYRNLYFKYLFLIAGVVVWYLFHNAGLHATIAGFLLALTVPIYRKGKIKNYYDNSKSLLNKLLASKKNVTGHKKFLSNYQIETIENIHNLSSKLSSPLQNLEHKLHKSVAFIIMPVFALANAGVIIGGDMSGTSLLSYNIGISLIFGKSIGIMLFCYLAVKLKLAILPEMSNFKQILGIGLLGGFGFTMSLFISNLAFTDNTLLNSSKFGILLGSFIAGILGYIILKMTLKNTK